MSNIFMKIDGVTGSCSDKSYKGWIEIFSCRNLVNSNVVIDNGSGQFSSDGADIAPITIAKANDCTTTELYQKVTQGEKIKNITVVLATKENDKTIEEARWEYNDCMLTSFCWDVGENKEEYGFVFGEAKLQTNMKNKDGQLSKQGPVGWNVIENTKL